MNDRERTETNTSKKEINENKESNINLKSLREKYIFLNRRQFLPRYV